MKNDAALKFGDDLQAKFALALARKEFQQILTIAKEAADNDAGTFEVMITTDDVDRAGEVIALNAWEFDNYLKSPVVLWGHNYDQMPIGVCTSLTRTDKGIIAKGRFAPASANPFAQQIREAYDLGLVRATSVGFIPKEMDGKTITKAELLEFSFVAVPCNPHALSLLSVRNLTADTFLAKGIMVKEEKPAELAPEPAKPADPAAPTEEQKGAVADEVAAEEEMDKKCANLDAVFTVMNAFLDVYFNPETPASDFSKLLKEAIVLLSKVADGGEVSADEPAPTGTVDTVAASIRSRGKTVFEKLLHEFKSHGILVNKDAEAVRHATASLKAALVALEGLTIKSVPEGDTKAQLPGEGDDFKAARSLMQDVATLLGEGLADLKERSKNH